MFRRFVVLTTLLCTAAVTAFAGSPTATCQKFPNSVCVTPFLQDINCCGGNFDQGIGSFLVAVRTNNGPEADFLTNNGGNGGTGFIVLLGPVGTNWLITVNSGNSANVGVCNFPTAGLSASITGTQTFAQGQVYEPVFQSQCQF